VFWPESKAYFPAVVEGIGKKKGQYYDVLYDELVDGLPCIERNLPSWRVIRSHGRSITSHGSILSEMQQYMDDGNSEHALSDSSILQLSALLASISPGMSDCPVPQL